MGLTTPTAAEREFLWSQVSVPSAGLSPATGGYKPHRIKKRLHDGPWRYIAEGGGLRGGKSLGLAMEIVAWLAHSNLIWLAAETYDLTRQEFEYALEAATSLGWVSSVSMSKNQYQPCTFETTWGCIVQTRSLHDLGSGGSGAALVARAPDFIGICEPGFAPFEALQQAQERLTTRRGRLWMAGTFERANTWYVDIWHAWAKWPNVLMGKSLAVPSWLNTASFPGGKHDPEIEAIKRSYASMREFLVRWGGVPMASEALVMGAYWDIKKHTNDQIKFQPVDNEGHKMPVYLMIDPGFSGKSVYAVEVCQRFGKQMIIVDEVAVQTLVHEEVIDLCRTKPWWPHIAGGTIDPYAGASHVYGGLSPQEIWWRHGKIALQAPPRYEVEDVVSRLQHVMRDPANGRSFITISPRCSRLIWEMSHWRRVTTRLGMGKPSDANCDAIKAVAYYVSAKYTEDALGLAESTKISVHDYTINGGTPRGVSHADRYANYHRR